MSDLDPTAPGVSFAPTPERSEPESEIPQPGARIGRFVVLGTLGSGGMGVVLAAYDPELDRKAALKLLKPSRRDQEYARERLRREAQALAKLDHENVVTVFDVGIHEGRVFLAMEFVAGQTLEEWFHAEGPRHWREVLRVLMAAGRGLAAAHAAGLVHRDFKPSNVMIDERRRVRVMDFGLVHRGGEDSLDGLSSASSSSSLSQGKLTRTGASLGTPTHMAPEQWRHEEVTPLTDQFGFCVALYEGLYGSRPFPGETISEIECAVLSGTIEPPPRGTRVPTWLRKVVSRGLALEPSARHESIQALLTALADDPALRRRRWAAGLVGGALIGLGSWGVATMVRAETHACADMEAKLAGVWDDARRAEVEAAMLGTGLDHAAQTSTRVGAALDAYARDYVEARVEACEATRRGEQSESLLDLRMACLDERRDSLRVTVDELIHADTKVLTKATQVVLELPSFERCADTEALLAELPPPDDPEVAARVADLDLRLLAVKAQHDLGQVGEGRRAAEAILREAETLDYPPIVIRARLRLGLMESAAGEYLAAEATLTRTYHDAVALRMTKEAAFAASKLVYVVGLGLARLADAKVWAAHADSIARAAESDEARAAALNNLGIVTAIESDFAAARSSFEAALEIKVRILGPDHPSVAVTLDNLGNIARLTGHFAEAHTLHERALAIREATLGPDHPDVANTLGNLGELARAESKPSEALGYFQRELAIKVGALGPDHPQVGIALDNSCGLQLELGDLAKARESCERSLAIHEATKGLDHPDVAQTLVALATMDLAEHDPEAALTKLERALAIDEAKLEPGDPRLAEPLPELAQALLALGRPLEAIARLEHALTILVQADDDPELTVPRTRVLLARMLWDAGELEGRDRARAIELATLARITFANAGQVSSDELAELDAWLSVHADATR